MSGRPVWGHQSHTPKWVCLPERRFLPDAKHVARLSLRALTVEEKLWDFISYRNLKLQAMHWAPTCDVKPLLLVSLHSWRFISAGVWRRTDRISRYSVLRYEPQGSYMVDSIQLSFFFFYWVCVVGIQFPFSLHCRVISIHVMLFDARGGMTCSNLLFSLMWLL